MNFAVAGLALVLLSASFSGAAPLAVVDVKLSPAGSFKGRTSEVAGSAVLADGEVSAQNIVVNLKSLKTGIPLRDKHTVEHLEVDKYPDAVLVIAKGKNGKGVAKIRIRGVEKQVRGTYKIVGKELAAEFPIHLPDFKISGIKYLGVGVEDDVTVHVNVPITATAPSRAAASTAKGR